MKYPTPLLYGKLIKRYKRFLADIELENGEMITAHCPNTGPMKACIFPEGTVLVSFSDNKKRKCPYTWEQVIVPNTKNNTRIGINTARANTIIEELLLKKAIPELASYQNVIKEVRYGAENSRADFKLTSDDLVDCYIEVKSVTYHIGDGVGLFPDAVSTRGAKHLRELIACCKNGLKAVLIYCIQHSDIESVSAAKEIDPVYSKLFYEAIDAGVCMLAYKAKMTDHEINIVNPAKVILN